MSTHTTETVAAVEPAEQAEALPLRDALMHALAAAEDAIGALPAAMPPGVDLTEYDGAYDVRLFFHGDGTQHVREFAATYDVPVRSLDAAAVRPGWSFIEAVTYIRGVHVRAWTLTENEAEQHDPEATVETEAPAAEQDAEGQA